LGSVLNNAKDWEGYRLLRQKKTEIITDEKWKEYIVIDNVQE